MKTKITYTVLFALACTIFLSCNEEKPMEAKTTTSFKRLTKVNWEVCTDSTEYQSHKLGNEEAINALNSYKSYIDNVKDTLTKYAPHAFPDKVEKLNYGSEVDFDMLLEVLAHRKLVCSDKLFLMNVMRPKVVNGIVSKKDSVAEIMFVIESQDEKGLPMYTYFDFTRPCPNGCPEDIPGIEYPHNKLRKTN